MNGRQLFSTPIHEYTKHVKDALTQAIERAPESDISNANDDYAEGLVNQYRFQALTLNWEGSISLTGRREQKVRTRDMAWEAREITVQCYTFEVNFTGSKNLLYIAPSTRRIWKFEPEVNTNTIKFEVMDTGSEQGNKQSLQSIRQNLEHDISNLNKELSSYHSEIAAHAQRMLQQRKDRIESAMQSMGGFGVPIRSLDSESEA